MRIRVVANLVASSSKLYKDGWLLQDVRTANEKSCANALRIEVVCKLQCAGARPVIERKRYRPSAPTTAADRWTEETGALPFHGITQKYGNGRTEQGEAPDATLR